MVAALPLTDSSMTSSMPGSKLALTVLRSIQPLAARADHQLVGGNGHARELGWRAAAVNRCPSAGLRTDGGGSPQPATGREETQLGDKQVDPAGGLARHRQDAGGPRLDDEL